MSRLLQPSVSPVAAAGAAADWRRQRRRLVWLPPLGAAAALFGLSLAAPAAAAAIRLQVAPAHGHACGAAHSHENT